jgi:hypothetical protein
MPIPAGFVSHIDLLDPLCYPGSGLIIEDLQSPSTVWDISASGTTYDGTIGALTLTTQSIEANTLLVPTGTAAITIAGWIKVNSYTYGSPFNALPAVGSSSGGNNFRQYPLYGGTPNAIAVASGTNTSGAAVYGASEQPINEWCFVVIKKDSATSTAQIITYLNGVNDVGGNYGGAVTTNITYSGTFSYGAINTTKFGDNQQNMSVSQFWMYNSFLSDADVLDLYNATVTRYFPPVPVAEYDFQNGSYPGTGNTWFDLSANNNDLALSNQTFATTPVKSFTFANGYANNPTPTNLPTNIFTIDAWIKFNSTSQQIVYGVGKDSPSATQALIAYRFPGINSGKPFFEMGSGNARLNLTSDPTLGVWNNYVITADGTNVKAYINGVLDVSGSQSGGSIGNTNTGIILGQLIDGTGGPSGLYYSDASFGQFSIYNEALDAGTILQNYDDTKTQYVLPIAQYDFSDTNTWTGTGNTAYDLSPYNNDLTLSNGPLLTGTGTSKTLELRKTSAQTARKSTALNGITDIPMTFNIWSKVNPATNADALMSYGVVGDSTIPGIWSKFFNEFISFEGGFSNPVISSGITANNTDFYNIIVSINPSTATLYVNGTGVGTSNHTISLPAGSQFSLSGLFGTNLYDTNADIGLVEVYNVALGSTQVTDLYNTQSPRFISAPPPSSNGVGGRQFAQGFNG